MYDEYSQGPRDDDYYEQGRRGRQRAPQPPPNDYPPEQDYPPPRRGPPHDARGPPPRPQRYKPPRGPNQIPGAISICVILGILLMFIGLALMTIATPTTPPPEIPEDPDTEYAEDYADWQRDIENAQRNEELIKQIGIIIHDLGAMLAGLGLIVGGLMLSSLDMKLRVTLIIVGIVLVVIMFMVPFGWLFLSSP